MTKQAWQAVLDDLNQDDRITVNLRSLPGARRICLAGKYRGLERTPEGFWYLVLYRKNANELIETKLINWIVRNK